MKAIIPLVALITLAGCDTPAKRLKEAEDRLALMEKTGASKAELCTQREKVYQAALDTADESAVEMARLEKEVDCTSARLEAMGYGAPVDPDVERAVDAALDESTNEAERQALENQAEALNAVDD